MGHLHSGIPLGHKKKEEEEKFTLSNNMDIYLENIMLGEISQSENDKYHMIPLICGIQ